MRLICPNCAAQYEVPTDVIPQGGRDVQCSNCGHTWFQAHPDDDPDLAEELNTPIHDDDWEAETDDPEPAPTPQMAATPQRPTVPDRQRPDASAAGSVASAGREVPRTRELDPEVADVLREEREHEVRQRAAEAGAMESQPDLGLLPPDEDEQARRAREAREHMARMRGEDSTDADARLAAATAASAAAGSRRELLPDVEEINQTLRSAEEPRVVDQVERREPPDKEDGGGGFARGFFLVIVFVGLLIAIYASAESIAQAVPALSELLSAYVGFVDGLRLWLDGQVSGLLQTLDAMSSEAADTGAAEPADN